MTFTEFSTTSRSLFLMFNKYLDFCTNRFSTVLGAVERLVAIADGYDSLSTLTMPLENLLASYYEKAI